jgi:hypothetical protein
MAVKILAIYCALGYLLIQVLYLGVWCRPIYNYWAVPIPPGHGILFSLKHFQVFCTDVGFRPM